MGPQGQEEIGFDDWLDGGLSVNEACEFAGIGRTMLYAWMSAGLVEYRKHGSRRIIARRSLARRLSEGSPGRGECASVSGGLGG